MNLFKRNHPYKNYIYAVTTGTYVGELLVYIEDTRDVHHFLSIPKMINRDIPKSNFKDGLSNKIVDAVEKLPASVYKVCQAQFKRNKSTK